MRRNTILSHLNRLSRALTWIAGLILVLFTLRRWLFLLAAAKGDPPARQNEYGDQADVLLLVPFKDEAGDLPGLLRCLDHLAYPAERLTIVLVDDGSTDGGNQIAQAWVSSGVNRHLLTLTDNVGKASALNAALARYPHGDLVAIYDADERPAADALTILCRRFGDAQVGAVSGRRAISNPLASRIASHAAFENLVHQMVTMRAKERLDLAPALLGSNCVYRRQALAGVGNFLPGAILEDSDLTLKLARAGWRIHFVPAAISYHAAPETVAAYWRQHLRWTVGFQAVAQQQAAVTWRSRYLRWPLRLELLLFSLGYLDRAALLLMALLAGARLVAQRRIPLPSSSILLAALLTPLLQVAAALRQTAAPPALWRRVLWLPIFLQLEILVTVFGLLGRGAAKDLAGSQDALEK